MIKKLLLAFAFILPLCASAQTFKMGLVNVDGVMQAMPEFSEAQAKLADTSKKYEAEFQKLQDEMKRLYDEFQKMDENELPAIRERKTRELADYDQKLQTFQQTAMQDLQRMQTELMGPITAKISQAVESVGKENGYSLVQVMEPQLTLYHAAPVDDITPLVKAKLGIK
ncbi:MAG: OmpH family outer membrane protein [Muribaculaceae bacterium]|nr:OmpH family outer membrane protein [Muribaculaceae bacterium]